MNRIGTQILEQMDVYLHRGSDDDIWAFPTRVDPNYVDWHEVLLRDADLLLNPSYETKKITIELVVLRATEQRLKSVRTLFDAPSIELYVGQFGQTYKLSPLRITGYKHIGGVINKAPGCGILVVELEQSNLPDIYNKMTLPTQKERTQSFITLDGVDLSTYGIVVQQAYDTGLMPHALKRPREVVPSKSISIECTMVSSSIDGLNGNLSALWKAIDKIGSCLLDVAGSSYNVYYTSMTNCSKLLPFRAGNKHFLKFTLNFQTVYEEVKI